MSVAHPAPGEAAFPPSTLPNIAPFRGIIGFSRLNREAHRHPMVIVRGEAFGPSTATDANMSVASWDSNRSRLAPMNGPFRPVAVIRFRTLSRCLYDGGFCHQLFGLLPAGLPR